ELLSVIRHHLIAPLHGAHRRFNYCAARVAKSLAWLEIRLLADHTAAARLLHVAVRIRNDPVARQQTRRHLTFVAYGNGVREDEALVARVGLFLDIGSLTLNPNSGIRRIKANDVHLYL